MFCAKYAIAMRTLTPIRRTPMTVSGPEKEAPMGITGFPLEKIFDMLVFESSNHDVMC